MGPPAIRGAERAAAVRPVIGALAEENTLPPENLLAPDIVRTLCWEGVELPATPKAVDARLAAGREVVAACPGVTKRWPVP